EAAHHFFLRHAARYGRAPDHRTKTDQGLSEEIATWEPLGPGVFAHAVRSALKLDPKARRERLAHAPRKPEARTTIIVVFNRNPDVVAEARLRARARCERCKQPAPFRRASDGTPYLEDHHLNRLADEGEDTADDAVALCPNCHRKQ